MELRKAAKTRSCRSYLNFPQNKKTSGFLPFYYGTILEFSAKFMKAGVLTCDFPADVGGYFWSPPPPEDRCDALRLVAGLVACNGNATDRLFRAILRKFSVDSRTSFVGERPMSRFTRLAVARSLDGVESTTSMTGFALIVAVAGDMEADMARLSGNGLKRRACDA